MQMTKLCLLSVKNAIVTEILRHNFSIILERFYQNFMVLNADKCHFLTLGFNEPFTDFSFNNTTTENVTKEKFGKVRKFCEEKLNFQFQSNLKNCLFAARGWVKLFFSK